MQINIQGLCSVIFVFLSFLTSIQAIVSIRDAEINKLFFASDNSPEKSVVDHNNNNNTLTPSSRRRQRLAVARTFCENDAMKLLQSFSTWDELPPCTGNKRAFSVDLVLSFSQSLNTSVVGRQAVEAVIEIFEQTQGWNGCFEKLIVFGTNIDPWLDLYRPQEKNTNVNWVNGPNRQFEQTVRIIDRLGEETSHEKYTLMYLMEGDCVPLKSFWLDAVISEIEEMHPFAILGSKYKGDKWDSFFNKLPSSLIHHINGNAVYNLTHPFFLNLVGELESEANTTANAVPFDYRIQQIIQEGRTGIPPTQSQDFPNTKRMPTKTAFFQQWIKEYPPQEVVKQSLVIGNYASTNIVQDLVNPNVYIVHGANMYKPWNNSAHGEITLVVSDWIQGNSHELLSSLDESKHPFTEAVIIQPNNKLDLPTDDVDIPTFLYSRGNDRMSMDFCSVPITTEWFVLTNSYFRLRPIVTIMVDDDDNKSNGDSFRPVVSTALADEDDCFGFPVCLQDFQIAKYLFPKMTNVFHSDNVIFKTSIRDRFCKKMESLLDTSDLLATPATAYMAFIEAEGIGMDTIYKISDRRTDGSRSYFVRLHDDFISQSGHAHHIRHLQAVGASNETDCTSAVSAPECNSRGGCLWRPDFASCRDVPLSSDFFVNGEKNVEDTSDILSYISARGGGNGDGDGGASSSSSNASDVLANGNDSAGTEEDDEEILAYSVGGRSTDLDIDATSDAALECGVSANTFQFVIGLMIGAFMMG